jgi:branched-chain amino acid transport system substrate-binding protein
MPLHRRKVLQGLAGAAALAGIKAPMVMAQAAPFKIALLTVKTGPLAQGGIQMEQGILTLLKEKNNTLAGRKVELISADTGGNPAGAKTKAQEVIERDKANVVLGPLAAFELLAITDYIKQQATPLIRRPHQHSAAIRSPTTRRKR